MKKNLIALSLLAASGCCTTAPPEGLDPHLLATHNMGRDIIAKSLAQQLEELSRSAIVKDQKLK